MKLFDGHCDTVSKCYEQGCGIRSREGHLDLERTSSFARYAQIFAIFTESGADWKGASYLRIFLEQYALFQREISQNADLISFCRTWGEAELAFLNGKAAAFLSVEGADTLDCDLIWLEKAYKMGVRAINLTWNRSNLISGSCSEEPERGLSALGAEFMHQMQSLGILVDLSHLSDPGIRDVLELACRPVIASHSNARAVFPHQRNLTDEQFTAIIKNGGVACLCMYADFLGKNANLDTVIAHLEHFCALGGERNVGIGGDWDGCSRLPRGMSGIQDMEKLYERLLSKNYNEELINAVFYSNLMRVVNEVCIM